MHFTRGLVTQFPHVLHPPANVNSGYMNSPHSTSHRIIQHPKSPNLTACSVTVQTKLRCNPKTTLNPARPWLFTPPHTKGIERRGRADLNHFKIRVVIGGTQAGAVSSVEDTGTGILCFTQPAPPKNKFFHRQSTLAPPYMHLFRTEHKPRPPAAAAASIGVPHPSKFSNLHMVSICVLCSP